MEHEDVIEKLKNIEIKNIKFSYHAEENLKIRNFSKGDVIKLLKGTVNIVNIVLQQDDKPGKRYKLWIKKSGKYNFVVVINVQNGTIRVVTFHLEARKRMQRLEKWLKRK